MNFSNTSDTNRRQNKGHGSGINFELPTISIDLNSITEALNPRNFNISANIEDLMSSGRRSTRVRDTNCQSCDFKFTLLRRRRTCYDCNMDFCGHCLSKNVGNDRLNHCKRCVVFNCVPLDRNALNNLKIRDLKWFLASKRINYNMCNEKSELIDLIIERLSPQTHSSNSGHYERRFDNYNTSQRREPLVVDSSPDDTNDDFEIIDVPDQDDPIPVPLINDTQDDTSSSVGASQQIKEDTSQTNLQFNIDDIESIERLRTLTVKQLKLILTRNFIDYRGCLEREELLTKAERLWNDRQDNRQNINNISDEDLCKICMEERIDCVLLECGHYVSCTKCGKQLNECPICRQYVIRVVHTFKA